MTRGAYEDEGLSQEETIERLKPRNHIADFGRIIACPFIFLFRLFKGRKEEKEFQRRQSRGIDSGA